MFEYFISLGWFCGTAASLSKYGLRSFSSPFDWCFSDFDGVIHFLENDFADFLYKDNLRVIDGKSREFEDIKYGLHFNHDVEKCFEEEYERIREKYARRIRRFCIAVKEGVCFIRAVRNADELDYIMREDAYISRVIRKYNKNNEIIYLIPQYMEISSAFKGKFFMLNINSYAGNDMSVLRKLFETNEEFISFCISNCDDALRRSNLLFDLKKENDRLQRLEGLEKRHELLLKIVRTDFNEIVLPEKTAIYGAGDNGKILFENIKDKCTVTCFIDSKPKENEYGGIPIIPVQKYSVQKDTVIIVTPVYAFEEILSELKAVGLSDELKVISIESIFQNRKETAESGKCSEAIC